MRRTITTQGEVRGGYNGKHCWLMELNSIAQTILNDFSTEFLYVKILALGGGVSSFFCHAKAKLPRNTVLLRFADGNYR